MKRIAMVVLLLVAAFGCSEKSPTAPTAPTMTTAALFTGIDFLQPVYDLSDGQLRFAGIPLFQHPENVAADSMWVNINLYLDQAAMGAVVLEPKPQPCYWTASCVPADSLSALVCYKWLVGSAWSETTFVMSRPIVAQP